MGPQASSSAPPPACGPRSARHVPPPQACGLRLCNTPLPPPPPPAPSLSCSPRSPQSTAVHEDLLQSKPLDTASIHTSYTGARLGLTCVSSTPLCSSCPELSQCSSSPRPPHLQAQAPAGPSTSPAHNPDPRKILRSSELSPPPCVCLTLWAEGGPPLLCVPSAPVQSLCAHSQGGGGSNATSPALRSRYHLGRGRPPCSGSPEPSTG